MVLSLLEGYENKGHVVFMDNFYSSPILYAKNQKRLVHVEQLEVTGVECRKSYSNRI